MAGPLAQTLEDKLQHDRMRNLSEREGAQNEMRNKLRDFATFLREPGHPHGQSPASPSIPSFKLGDAHNFPHVSAQLPTSPGNGHLSPPAAKEFYGHLADAAQRQDPASRDAATGRAATVAAKDWAHQHGVLHDPKGSVKAEVLHEARAQATFVAREIGQKLGIGPVQSSLIGYSLERALEKEGFKVLVNHAVDKGVDVFKATASAAATATGMRSTAESNLSKSMAWLASHGVTPEAFKNVVSKHAGKISAVAELSQHPEVVARAANIISHSPKGISMVMNLAKDDDLRKAVGTMTLSAGETLAHVNKGVGSVAILAGSAMRGDSMEDTGRHAFRAAMSILGGAAGGIAAGAASAGFGSIAGGIAGAAAGSAAADYLIKVYDKHVNNGHAPEQVSHVKPQELQESKALIAARAEHKIKDVVQHHGDGPGRSQDREHTFSMNHKP